ncbi:hypothetical protein KIL84_001101 [Mauremys mutica]|uniref:Uncharacterized protein n=1 Tax=Mauremys mutica TaxID=74926 RepID=A0A9D4AVF1_9SAUR|nr:hypothetical protein KIL84_001101 [Mauremys mutica]
MLTEKRATTEFRSLVECHGAETDKEWTKLQKSSTQQNIRNFHHWTEKYTFLRSNLTSQSSCIRVYLKTWIFHHATYLHKGRNWYLSVLNCRLHQSQWTQISLSVSKNLNGYRSLCVHASTCMYREYRTSKYIF